MGKLVSTTGEPVGYSLVGETVGSSVGEVGCADGIPVGMVGTNVTFVTGLELGEYVLPVGS